MTTANGIKRMIMYIKASFAKNIWPWSIAHSLIKNAIKKDTKPPGIKYPIRIIAYMYPYSLRTSLKSLVLTLSFATYFPIISVSTFIKSPFFFVEKVVLLSV